MQLLLVTM